MRDKRQAELGGLTAGEDETRVFLTFDDGPDPVWTPRVLEMLRRSGARATFFVSSPPARRSAALIPEMLRAGHGVELHCAEHVRHTERSRREVGADTRGALRDLAALGARPRLWRPPWGVMAPWTASVAEEFGLEIALWGVDTHDWRGDPAPEMLARIGPRLVPGSVVLMHDGLGPGARRDGCGETVALVEGLIERVRSNGCEPAPLGPSASVSAPPAAREEARA